MANKEGITVKKDKDFSEWYTQVVTKSGMIEYSQVSGCYVLRPLAYEIWEKIQSYFDKKIKKKGVKNAYFPLLIPESLLKKEASHVKGFAPEVAWVTHAGDSKLDERLAIRPTSETIIYDTYAKWIRSHRDLPLRLNQWCSVVRWEFKHPQPFLRSREFLWQEGHTVFAAQEEAEAEVLDILKEYANIYENLLAIPVIQGKKSEKEKFAGAVYTTSIEALLPNGKAIQGATSHFLGQNFAKAFNIQFLNASEKKQHPYQNSWGISTRALGILIIMHADDKGLIIPPKIAENKLVIIPIIFDESKDKILKKAEELKEELKKFNPILDERDDYSPGWKFNEWELKGIPLRIELGPKDLEKKQVLIVRRDTGEKIPVKWNNVEAEVPGILEDIQKGLYNKAQHNLENSIKEVKTQQELIQVIKQNKFALMSWCNTSKCEESIKDKTGGAKSLNLPFNKQKNIVEICPICQKKSTCKALFGRSY